MHGTRDRILPKFSMAKRGRPKKTSEKVLRGPYKSEDTEDPDLVGIGGIRLRQHRLARFWTVEKMAEEAGTSPGTISGIENGKGYSPTMLSKLARALGITVGELFDLDPRPGKGGELMALVRRLKPAQRQRVMDFTKGLAED